MQNASSETFRTVPNPSEAFRNLPNDSEAFRNVPNLSERKENHILTAREVTHLFEEAGVPRTERSIINWCHPDKHGVSRLDCFYDANERKYFITPQSVDRAINEEQAKAKTNTMPNASETAHAVPNDGASDARERSHMERETVEDIERMKELEKAVRDLEITNRAKDYFIDRLEADRERFAAERERWMQQLVTQSRTIGQLETQLLQLEAPKERVGRDQIPPVKVHNVEVVDTHEPSPYEHVAEEQQRSVSTNEHHL